MIFSSLIAIPRSRPASSFSSFNAALRALVSKRSETMQNTARPTKTAPNHVKRGLYQQPTEHFVIQWYISAHRALCDSMAYIKKREKRNSWTKKSFYSVSFKKKWGFLKLLTQVFSRTEQYCEHCLLELPPLLWWQSSVVKLLGSIIGRPQLLCCTVVWFALARMIRTKKHGMYIHEMREQLVTSKRNTRTSCLWLVKKHNTTVKPLNKLKGFGKTHFQRYIHFGIIFSWF